MGDACLNIYDQLFLCLIGPTGEKRELLKTAECVVADDGSVLSFMANIAGGMEAAEGARCEIVDGPECDYHGKVNAWNYLRATLNFPSGDIDCHLATLFEERAYVISALDRLTFIIESGSFVVISCCIIWIVRKGFPQD